MRWLACVLPPVVFVAYELTPGLSGLNGINAAGLLLLSPIVIAIGFGCTAGLVALARWLCRKLQVTQRWMSALLCLTFLGLVNALWVEGDWLLLCALQLASLPAALLLPPAGAKAAAEAKALRP